MHRPYARFDAQARTDPAEADAYFRSANRWHRMLTLTTVVALGATIGSRLLALQTPLPWIGCSLYGLLDVLQTGIVALWGFTWGRAWTARRWLDYARANTPTTNA
jgi:hypothetical protein